MGHGTSTVCLHSVTRDSLPGVRSGGLALQFPGPDLSHPSNNGRRAQGQGHSGTLSGQGPPHGSVFFRKKKKKKKKKTGCKHKLYFLEKECAFPTCLFIYKPWENWVPELWGPWAPSGTALSPCAPALRQSDPGQLLCPVWGTRACLQSQMASGLKTAVSSGWIFLQARHPTPLPPGLLAWSLPASFSDSRTLSMFLKLKLG